MMPELLSVAVILPAQALCLLPMGRQLKYGWGRTVLLLLLADTVCFPAAAFLLFRFAIGINTVLLPMLLVFFTVYQLCLKCPVCKSLAVFLAVCALMSALSNLSCALEAQTQPHGGADQISVESALLQLGMNALGAGLLAWPVRKYGSELVDRLDLSRIWFLTVPFSLVLTCANLFLRPLKYETLFVNNVYRSFVICVLATLVLWVMLCVMFYHIVTDMLESARRKERMQMLEMQESQFAAQQQYMEASARARHDFRQSILTMRNLFRAGDYGALGQYLEEYSDGLPAMEGRVWCGIPALNALLNYYAGLAREKAVRVSFRVELPESLPVSDVDLCSTVGNILENAITACQELPEAERHIHLTMLVRNGRFYLVATNSHTGRLRRKNGQYLSTRRKGEGLGLKSIRATAVRYGGTAEFSHDEREFVSNVMLPLASPMAAESRTEDR